MTQDNCKMVRIRIFILFISLLAIILLPSFVSSGLQCYITEECDATATAVLRLKNDTAGYSNAHAEMPSQSLYPYAICCNYTDAAVVSTECNAASSNAFLKLANITDSHVQQPSVDTYAYDACINISGVDISCVYPTAACGELYTCLGSMASDGNSNATNAHFGSCDDYTTRICCKGASPPIVDSVLISPDPAYTNSAISCSVAISSPDLDQVTVNISWYNGTAFYSSELFQAYHGETNTSYLLPAEIQNRWEVWNCSAFAYIGGLSSGQKSDTINITNTLPEKVVLIDPTNHNMTIQDRTPLFDWQDAVDIDNDVILYEINITSNTGCGGDRNVGSIAVSQYTPTDELCTYDEPHPAGGTVYNWTVRACDDFGCGVWSNGWNFTIEPFVVITLLTDKINFSVMDLGEEDDTTDDNPEPFRIQNDGNVVANLVNVSTNMSLWRSPSAPLGTSYFRMKAGIAEAGSFNEGVSRMTWTNVSTLNQSIIIGLNYTDSKDTAELDIGITVPSDEPQGSKLTYLIFTWAQS